MPVFDYLLNALVQYLKRRQKARQKKKTNRSSNGSRTIRSPNSTSKLRKPSRRRTEKGEKLGLLKGANGRNGFNKGKKPGTKARNLRPISSRAKSKRHLDRGQEFVSRHSAGKPSTRAKRIKHLKTDSKDKSQGPQGERIGVITHYFSRIQVVVLKMTGGALSVGEQIHIRGKNGGFVQTVESLQIESVDVKYAKKGQLVGLKVLKKANPGDLVFKVK